MNDIEELIKWFEKNNSVVRYFPQTTMSRENTSEIGDKILTISFFLKNDFPEFSERIVCLKNKLVLPSGFIDPSIFGRISELLKFIKIILEKREYSQWKYIHNAFHGGVKEKFLHGFYTDAVFTATKILIERLKIIHKNIYPNDDEIDGSNLVGKIFSKDKQNIIFSEQNTISNKDIQKGYHNLFQGCISAIRNKNAHNNEKGNEIYAFQDIVFMSILMTALDSRIAPQQFVGEK